MVTMHIYLPKWKHSDWILLQLLSVLTLDFNFRCEYQIKHERILPAGLLDIHFQNNGEIVRLLTATD